MDAESGTVISQCKLVRRLSLTQLTGLAEQVEREAAPKFRANVVAARARPAVTDARRDDGRHLGAMNLWYFVRFLEDPTDPAALAAPGSRR